MFGILGWIVFGLIVGVIAKLLMPGKDPGGIIVTMLLGIVGAVLGGYRRPRDGHVRSSRQRRHLHVDSSARSSCCSSTGWRSADDERFRRVQFRWAMRAGS